MTNSSTWCPSLGIMWADDKASAMPNTMALHLQTEKMSCFLIGAELDKCSEAEKAIHTSADGIVWAAAEGAGADWLDLFKGGPWAGMRTGDAALTTGGGLAARGASVLCTLRGGMLSRRLNTQPVGAI